MAPAGTQCRGEEQARPVAGAENAHVPVPRCIAAGVGKRGQIHFRKGNESTCPLAPVRCALALLAVSAALPVAAAPINVGNFVWEDIDGDGVQDAGEPGMAGVTVQLWNGAKTSLLDSATTNASGNYSLVAPAPGQYRMRVLLPSLPGARFSPKDQGGSDLRDSDIHPSGSDFGFTGVYTLSSVVVSITSIDSGILLPSAIGDRVWDDADEDGIQDPGEAGIDGVTVQLWNDARNQLLDSTSTGAGGIYTLIAPAPGNYRVRVLRLSNVFSFSPKDRGDDALDSDIHPDGALAGFTDTLAVGTAPGLDTRVDAGLTGLRVFADGIE